MISCVCNNIVRHRGPFAAVSNFKTAILPVVSNKILTCRSSYQTTSVATTTRTTTTTTTTSKVPFYGAPRQTLEEGDVTKSASSRWKLAAHSAISAWWDPTRAGDVAALGNITATYALYHVQQMMNQDPTGKRILQDRPLVNRQNLPKWIVDLATGDVNGNGNVVNNETSPRDLAENFDQEISFGHAYAAFMRQHGFDPDERSPVQYIDDSELAYIMLRYRQCHDYWHTLTGLPPTVLGEVGLKWLELFQTGLPVAALSATAGSLRLFSFQDRQVVFQKYIPWAIRTSKQLTTPLINVYYEEEFDTPLLELRQRLRIETAPH